MYAKGLITAKVFINNKAKPINHNDKNKRIDVKKFLKFFIKDFHKAKNGFVVL